MKMRIFVAAFACMTGIAFHQAVAAGIPPRPSDKQLLSCIAGYKSYNETKCDKAKHDLEKHMDAVSDACKDADTWEGKKIWLKKQSDKIVVCFTLTIYPYSLTVFIYFTTVCDFNNKNN